MMTSQQQEQAMFGGWLQALYPITPPTPTGDMQDGMDAVMPMAMPAANRRLQLPTRRRRYRIRVVKRHNQGGRCLLWVS